MTTVYTLYKPTALDYTKLVSVVYAVSLISFGIIFPIAEALKDEWLETVYHTVFLTFTLTLSSFFLVYLLFFVLRQEKNIIDIDEKNTKLSKLKKFYSDLTSKLKRRGTIEDIEAMEEGKKDLLDERNIITIEEPVYKHRFTRRRSNASFNSFSGLEFVMHKHHHKSIDNLSIGSFHKSSKILNLRGVEPVHDFPCNSSRKHKRSNYSLSNNHSAFERDLAKDKFKGPIENVEDSKGESEEEEDDNDTQTWINTDSFGNVFTHHGSNLFLRLGILVFGLGNLVNYALEIQANLITNVECSHKMRFGWIFIWMFIFVFLQTFFLFKHAKIKVTKHQPLVWFGMVHLIFTNINLWIHTLIQEIIDEYHYKTISKLHSKHSTIFNEALKEKCDTDLLNEASKYLTPFVFEYSLVAVGSISCFLYFGAIESKTNFKKTNRNIIKVFSLAPSDYEQYDQQMNIDEAKASQSGSKVKFSNLKNHAHNSTRSKKFENMKGNNAIALANHTSHPLKPPSTLPPIPDTPIAMHHSDDLSDHDPLRKSHTGMFVGMVILCITVVTCVVFLFSQLQHNRPRAEIIYFSTDIVIHSLLLIACLAAFILTKDLAFAPKPVNTDDVLILLAAFGSITYELINASALFTTLRTPFESSPSFNATIVSPTFPATSYAETIQNTTSHLILSEPFEHNELDPFHLIRDQLQLASACLGMVQTAVQALLIFVSLRRYPVTMVEATEMPGRGTMAFLIVGNLSAWILRTILCKNLQLPAQISFYGEMGCLLLTNIHLPMLLFFRFHSSVCLVDIWKCAYQLLTQDPSLYSL